MKKKKVIITSARIKDGWNDYAKLKPPTKRSKLLNVQRKGEWLFAFWVKR